jgi:catechol 2,3-dioxygenase-like lactoylglutathione lyase family enzyme
MTVRALDHFVLRVADLERSLAFYGGLLGIGVEGLDEHRRGEKPFVSLRIGDSLLDLVPDPTFDPTSAATAGGFVHFCMTVAELDRVVSVLRAAAVHFLHDEPVPRGGARGVGPSIYAVDPDGYVVELKQWTS